VLLLLISSILLLLVRYLAEIRLGDEHALVVREYFRYCRPHFRSQYSQRPTRGARGETAVPHNT
jgi:hypothetical protein